MQKAKRPLSFVLAVLMIVSMFAAVPFSALAVPEGTPLTDQLPSTQGTYYLTQDITISSTWLAPSGATTLDLNGYGIRMTGTGTVIDVCRDASCVLTLNDSQPTYSGGENRPSGILGGYITGGTGSTHPGTSAPTNNTGGGIFVSNAVLNINGGTITGNSADWGGGIYINNDCTVNMTGGAITGNSCARNGWGGGVFLSAYSTFNVSHTPYIMGNYYYSYNGKQYPKNVHMQEVASGGKQFYAVITIVSPGLTAGAQIGIYELQTNAHPVTSGYSTYHSGVNPATYFSCDTAGWAYKVVSGGELMSVPAFTITWQNEDGSLIDTTTVAGGTVPTHADATKDATAEYTYTFAGWSDGTTTYAPDDALPEVGGHATYTATFTRAYREYTITWKNDDGSEIDTTTVPYGTVPTHADATKDADAQYTYTFAGWDTAPVAVTGDATYTATFTQTEKTPNDQMSVSVDDQIHLNLYLDLDFRSKTADDVTITLGGKAYACEGTKETGGKYDGLYKFKVEMAPAQIADEIAVTINGDANPLTTSVTAYIGELSKPEYGATANELVLARAILFYGQAANNVFGYTGTTIAILTNMNKDAVQTASATFTDGTGKVTGASFMALTKPEFRFYTANIDEQTAYDYNEAGISATMANGGDTLTARFVKKADGKVLLEVKGISAENMDKVVTVTINALGQTITFNGNAFAKAMANPNNNEAQQNLGAALYNYGAAAKVCFGA